MVRLASPFLGSWWFVRSLDDTSQLFNFGPRVTVFGLKAAGMGKWPNGAMRQN
jgi:hypothetical protein